MAFITKLRSLLTPEKIDFSELINQGAIIIDVRSPQEFKSGHAKNSKNIPLQSINNQVGQLKGKEVILVCKSGARAARAKSILSKLNVNAYNAGSWQNIKTN